MLGVQPVVYGRIEGQGGVVGGGSSGIESVVLPVHVVDVTVDDVALMSMTIAFFAQNPHVGKTC